MRTTSAIIKIKKKLLELGIRQVDIAKRLGLGTGDINNVLVGRRKSSRIVSELVNLGVPKKYFSELKRR